MSTITRPKRTKQYTKEELLDLIKEFDNDKEKIAEYLNIGTWSLRDQLKRNDIEFDGRKIAHNKKEIPPKYVLEDMYFNQNMSLVEMSKHLDASNCTIKKWFDFYNIKILSMSDTIKYKCMPKIIEHNRKNYGVDYFYQTEQFKEISKETCMKRYGKPYHPSKNTSIVEIEVLDFFNSIKSGFEKDVIDNYELDGYNKKCGIAFEYCGLYWHREGIKGKYLHRIKYDICKKNNIRLFTIFADEWVYRKDQTKKFILNELNVYNELLCVDDLKMMKFRKNDISALEFLHLNDIIGHNINKSTTVHYGLINGDEIVMLISVRKNDKNDVVLDRYCKKSYINIIGGMERLIDNILNDYTGMSIKVWTDNRWETGEIYSKLGFSMMKEIKSDYSYVGISGKEIRKSKYASKNEIQLYNYDKIWDCGKICWILKR